MHASVDWPANDQNVCNGIEHGCSLYDDKTLKNTQEGIVYVNIFRGQEGGFRGEKEQQHGSFMT